MRIRPDINRSMTQLVSGFLLTKGILRVFFSAITYVFINKAYAFFSVCCLRLETCIIVSGRQMVKWATPLRPKRPLFFYALPFYSGAHSLRLLRCFQHHLSSIPPLSSSVLMCFP